MIVTKTVQSLSDKQSKLVQSPLCHRLGHVKSPTQQTNAALAKVCRNVSNLETAWQDGYRG